MIKPKLEGVPLLGAVCGVGMLAAFILFFNLGGARTLTYHEGLVGVVAREALQTGDWVIPRFGGLPQLTRPPLAFWLVASAGWLYGEVNEWIARLPFAVSGFLLVGLVGHWGWRWYGRRTGVYAALVQCSSVYVIMQARLAESDIVFCLLTTFALYMIAADLTGQNADRPSGRVRLNRFLSWIAIYGALGVSTLAKEIVGPVLVLFTTGSFIAIQRQWRSLWALANPVGLALFAVLAFAWPLRVGQEYPELWTIWYGQSFGRALGGLDHEPFWFYAVNVPWLMLPWAPVTAVAAVGSWKKAWSEGDCRERFLWAWFLSQVLFLTLSIGKHKHYVIPALPSLSLITGPGLERLVERIKSGSGLPNARQVAWSSFLWVMIGSVSVLAVVQKWPELVFSFVPAVALCGLGGCLALWLLRVSRLREAALAVLFVFVVCYITVFGSLLPARDPRRPAAQFARRVSAVLPMHQPTIVYAMSTTPVIFYLSRPAIRADTSQQLRDHVWKRKAIFVLTEPTQIEQLEKFADVRRIDEMKPAAESYLKNSPRLILVELTARSSD